MKDEDLKQVVKEKYGAIASQSNLLTPKGCCGAAGCSGELEFSMIGDEYTNIVGYLPDADLGLGCGLPTEFAGIKKGDSVLDLGSGAGNDCFVARVLVGDTGKVTGLDFSEEMLAKAHANLKKTGLENISFIKGDIDNMPLPENAYDVVISNCVLNLVPDKNKAFAEIFRVLKNGGHFCISDVVLSGELPAEIQKDAEMYVGCVSGALQREDYINIIRQHGFTEISVRKEKPIIIPDSILARYFSEDDLGKFKKSGAGISSITVTANK